MPFLIKDADYPVGGATVEWYSWIKGFEANNCEVGVLTWKGAEKYVENNKIINFVSKICFDRSQSCYNKFDRSE